jgi:hypothetical protein
MKAMVDPQNGQEGETDRPAGDMPAAAPPDPGFRRMVTWILLAFVFAAVVSLVAVTLVIHFFDKG